MILCAFLSPARGMAICRNLSQIRDLFPASPGISQKTSEVRENLLPPVVSTTTRGHRREGAIRMQGDSLHEFPERMVPHVPVREHSQARIAS